MGLKDALPPTLMQLLNFSLESGPIQLHFPKLSVSAEVCPEVSWVGKLSILRD